MSEQRYLPELITEPLVAWPEEAEPGSHHLVTVDLLGPYGTDPADWPYPAEEFAFTVGLDGEPFLRCTALDEPVLVLHRFGGTYGPARFLLDIGDLTGELTLWLTLANEHGVPVHSAALPVTVRTGAGGGEDPPDDTVRLPAVPYEDPRQDAGEAPPPGCDVLVAHTARDRPWAAWAGAWTARHGLDTGLRGLPVGPPPEPGALRALAGEAGRVLLVLGAEQLGADTAPVWAAALDRAEAERPGAFAVLAVGPVPPLAEHAWPLLDLAEEPPESAGRLLGALLGLPAEPPPPAPGETPGPRHPAEPGTAWGGVPARNPRFTGRAGSLDAMRHALTRADARGTGLVLWGLSGIGKTQLATEYAHRYGNEYDVVWWTGGESRSACRRGLAELADALGTRTAGAEYGTRLRTALDRLRRGGTARPWLLVVDGADEPERIRDLLPEGPGHVLVTSRDRDWASHLPHLFDVPTFSREESVAFVARRAPRLSAEDADALAEAVGDFPLVLDQVAGWLAGSRASVSEYLARLESAAATGDVSLSADFPVTFHSAWTLLINRLRDTGTGALDLLRLCTRFAPGRIPVHVLRDMPGDRVPPELESLLGDRRAWHTAAEELLRYSVVLTAADRTGEADGTGEADTFYLHRMVHQIARAGVPADTAERLDTTVRAALAAADPEAPSATAHWPHYAELVPHLIHAGAHEDTDEDVQRLVLNCLRYTYLSGDDEVGRELGRETFAAWERLLGAEHPRFWDLTHHYANVLRARGEYTATEQMDRAAVDHLRRAGVADERYPRALGGLAADLRGLGRYDEAYALSTDVARTYRALFGERASQTLTADNNIAATLCLLGDYEGARALDERTLAARRAVHGPAHPWTLFSGLSHALDLRLLGRYEEARGLLTESVAAHARHLGPEHLQTLRAEQNLALCRSRLGETEEAGAALASVASRAARYYGERHPLTLLCRDSLACHLREHGDLDEAGALVEGVAAAYTRAFGPGHPFTAGSRGNVALVAYRRGDTGTALTLAEAARADLEAAVGPAHPWALAAALDTAACQAACGEPEAAERLRARAEAGAARTLGPGHPLTLAAHEGRLWDFEAYTT
ncbi:FxSxx-COOH system tetratricopeptide repeat protein [Streptomyces sp. Tu6071]|uniref:FxSxx-COOH system tetratricopeptide repeat protein n=1 Tax=Streptomyces sp. Tu6071 TaxID=355249 RepID=UPI0002E67AD8|nr:FxSxx-COOH system tetratricopeptide repeat protein [Streptomyces sp. Tu6071]